MNEFDNNFNRENPENNPAEAGFAAPEINNIQDAENDRNGSVEIPTEDQKNPDLSENQQYPGQQNQQNYQQENNQQNAQPEFSANQFQQNQQYESNFNTVNYSNVVPVTDYKPASRGLKVFALIMAAVILLTGTCLVGYFFGKNSVKSGSGHNVSLNLAAKPTDTDEYTAAQVYDKVNKSIVGIRIYNESGAGAQASGVFYSEDGYIITNDHIYSEVSSPKFKIYTYDGKIYDATYVAGDTVSDIAVLKIDENGFDAATFGDSDELICGENVVAIGRPSDATKDSAITQGIISLTSRRVQTTSSYSARLIQTDSAINPGSSGGALINMYGQVVGITSSKISGVEYDAVGFAIPTKTVKNVAEELIANGKVTNRAKLGISYTAIDEVTAELNGYDYVGLYVASVSEDSDLYGKVKQGDIITHVNGVEIISDDIVLDIIQDSVAGDKLSITVISSSGTTNNYEVILKANVGESSYTTDPSKDNNSKGNSSSGNNSGSGDGTFDFPFGE